jgi:uncharacterized protein involved in outer membrane biogenesis
MHAPVTASPAKPSTSHTTRNVLLTLLAILVAVPIVACVFVATYDWNKAKPWLNAKVTDALDRPFRIGGDLSVQWHQPAAQMAGQDKKWVDFIPWPHLIARDIHLGNPAGMEQADMATLSEGAFSLDPLALLQHRIRIPLLTFQGPRVALLRRDEKTNNWTFRQNDQPSRWTFELERIVLTDGVVQFDDTVTRTHVQAKVTTLHDAGPYGIGWTLTGTYNGAPVTGAPL